jgi:hypothetical protein
MKRARYGLGTMALLAGCLVNYLGDRLLGVQIEIFSGLDTFSFAWIVDMFVVPFIVGLVVAIIFGLGGKWLCYFPPLIVRCINYALLYYGVVSPIPADGSLTPLGWWGLFVILVMEAAAFGGITGEVIMKGTYGRRQQQAVYGGNETDEGDS